MLSSVCLIVTLSIFGLIVADDAPEGSDTAPKCTNWMTENIDGIDETFCCDSECNKVKEWDEILPGWCGLDNKGCCPGRKNDDGTPFCPDDTDRRRLSPARSSDRYYWPNGYIPYEIASDMPSDRKARIAAAIKHYADNTKNIRLGKRNGESDYVRFVTHASSCSSSVGRVGGIQYIRIPNWCQTGSVIHEIGHALGLHHTQTREDRNDYIDINWANVPSDWRRNYDQVNAYYDDCLKYDYGSIMHYGAYLKGKKVITTKNPPGASIGQRNGLSVVDKGCIDSIYSRCRVALFQHDNFGGREYSPFGSNDYTLGELEALEFKNQDVSSMKITAEPDTKCIVQLYDWGSFNGDWKATIIADNTKRSSDYTFSYTLSQLTAKGFRNDDLSSMKIFHETSCEVSLYDFLYNGNIIGDFGHYGPGSYTMNHLLARGFNNDDVSALTLSISSREKCTVQFFQHDKYQGSKAEISLVNYNYYPINYELGLPELQKYGFLNQQTSSMKVIPVTLSGTNGNVRATYCKTVYGGKSGSNDDSKSSVQCPSGYDMMSCGIWGAWANIDGSYISGTTCYAQMGHGSSGSQYVRAYARCCKLSSTQTCTSYKSAKSGTSDDAKTYATCPSGKTLTGCTAQSHWKEIDGAYPTLLNGKQPLQNIFTAYATQRCTAQNGIGGNGVYAYAQCCSASYSKYKLQCGAISGPRSATHDDAISKVTCPTGWFLSGCSGYSPWKSAEGWYIYGNECRARNKNGGNGVYAMAICCQERYYPNAAKQVNEPVTDGIDDIDDIDDDIEPNDFDDDNYDNNDNNEHHDGYNNPNQYHNEGYNNKYFGDYTDSTTKTTTIVLSPLWLYILMGLVGFLIILTAVNCYINLSNKSNPKKPKYSIVYNQSESEI